jgi:hypothetical protein
VLLLNRVMVGDMLLFTRRGVNFLGPQFHDATQNVKNNCIYKLRCEININKMMTSMPRCGCGVEAAVPFSPSISETTLCFRLFCCGKKMAKKYVVGLY